MSDQPGGIHQVSLALGELRAEMRSAAEHRQDLHRKLDRLDEKLDEKFDAIDAQLVKVPALEARLDKLEPHVESFKAVRIRLAMLATVGGLTAGAGAFVVTNYKSVISFFKVGS